ncbi:protein TIC 20-II, chloroplastic [Phalaenopsis equestris]|uniref:protein TIC 20-II, chloroplastic n=1 Tax=Phalaenopsis equestris TaxID=78828 RepID=UPI0009E3A1FD|nr:protein TIC 20-II, chloroplastic [Phalaenopsis equestris]
MSTASLLRLHPLPPRKTLNRWHGQPSTSIHIPLRLHSLPSITNCSPRRMAISMSYRATVPASERLLAGLSYSLPFLNSLHYGRFLFARFPSLGIALEPLLPLIGAYRSLPYASFVAFFALYLGVVRNPAFGRYVRFNAMQAVVLDVLLALPALLQRIFGVPARGVGFRLLEVCYNVIFVVTAGCFLYGLVSCVLGKTPYLPLVASAADRQL